jgi:hypothetical protein
MVMNIQISWRQNNRHVVKEDSSFMVLQFPTRPFLSNLLLTPQMEIADSK